MRSITVLIGLLLLFLILGGIPVIAEDIPGSQDHPLLKRYNGSDIIKYDRKSFDTYTIPLAPSKSSSKLQDKLTFK